MRLLVKHTCSPWTGTIQSLLFTQHAVYIVHSNACIKIEKHDDTVMWGKSSYLSHKVCKPIHKCAVQLDGVHISRSQGFRPSTNSIPKGIHSALEDLCWMTFGLAVVVEQYQDLLQRNIGFLPIPGNLLLAAHYESPQSLSDDLYVVKNIGCSGILSPGLQA
jgi:hypothetical protein